MTEYTPAKTGEYPVIFFNFKNFKARLVYNFKKINVKMGERFAFVTEGEINPLVDEAVSENNIRSKRF